MQIEIETNFHTIDFLDILVILRNKTYRHYKKPNGKLFYEHTLSRHPPDIIRKLQFPIKALRDNTATSLMKLYFNLPS